MLGAQVYENSLSCSAHFNRYFPLDGSMTLELAPCNVNPVSEIYKGKNHRGPWWICASKLDFTGWYSDIWTQSHRSFRKITQSPTVPNKTALRQYSGWFHLVGSHPLAVTRKKHGTILKMVSTVWNPAYFYKSRHGATIMFMDCRENSRGEEIPSMWRNWETKEGFTYQTEPKGKAETG